MPSKDSATNKEKKAESKQEDSPPAEPHNVTQSCNFFIFS